MLRRAVGHRSHGSAASPNYNSNDVDVDVEEPHMTAVKSNNGTLDKQFHDNGREPKKAKGRRSLPINFQAGSGSIPCAIATMSCLGITFLVVFGIVHAVWWLDDHVGIFNTVHTVLSMPNANPMPGWVHQQDTLTTHANSMSATFEAYQKCQKDPACSKFPQKEQSLPHDNPAHIWHWSRENEPDPTLSLKTDCKGTSYREMYDFFHSQGYVIFESCSLQAKKDTLLKAVRDYTATIQAGRVQSAKVKAVRELSVDPDTLQFLEYIHGGRRVFPFQTLNFPKGTQQPFHSDLIHFDTAPTRTLMSAAWVALEDMNPDNGPLKYIPGSHLYGTWDFDEIGLQYKTNRTVTLDTGYETLYAKELERLATKQAGLKIKTADSIKYGQTFIWAAGFVHGGSSQRNKSLSRLSQVSHYFFDGADYFWQPRRSHLSTGTVRLLPNNERCHSAQFAPHRLHSCADDIIDKWVNRCEHNILSLSIPCTFV